MGYSFDPLGKKYDGDGYLYVRPLLGPKTTTRTGRFTFWGGSKVRNLLGCGMITWFYLDFILILSSILSCFCKEICTLGGGCLHDFILILSSTLSCFCKEIWTLGVGNMDLRCRMCTWFLHWYSIIFSQAGGKFEDLQHLILHVFEIQGFSSNLQGIPSGYVKIAIIENGYL